MTPSWNSSAGDVPEIRQSSTPSATTTRRTACRPFACATGCCSGRSRRKRERGQTIPWKTVREATVSEQREESDALTEARVVRLRELGRPEATLLADLLNYHRREAKPEWWAYYDRQKKSLDDLIEDTEAIACLSPAGDEQPVPDKKSTIVPLDFPDQEFKLAPHPKNQLEDPFRGVRRRRRRSASTANVGACYLNRGPTLAAVPLPSALVKGPADSRQRPARRTRPPRGRDRSLAAKGIAQCARCSTRDLPRIRGRRLGERIQTIDLDAQKALVAALDESYLFIQGPPGSGKTWTGARLIVSLLEAGRRVGVAALSHKAINNLLEEVENVAIASGVRFAGLKKCTDEDDRFDGTFIQNTTDNDECATSSAQLIAGTSWLFSRPAMEGRIEYLFVDEAGQLSLADTVAMGTSQRRIWCCSAIRSSSRRFSRASIRDDAGRSALEHLLARRRDRG